MNHGDEATRRRGDEGSRARNRPITPPLVASAPRRLVALFLLTLVFTGSALATWTPVQTHWYETLIGEFKAGWMSVTVEADEGHWRTRTETQLSIERGQAKVEVGLTSDFIETKDGRPVSVTSTQDMSSQSVKTRWVFKADHVEQTTWMGGRENVTKLPLPEGEWLPPYAADLYADARRAAGADSYSIRTVDPQSGITPITITAKRTGTSTYEYADRTLPVTTWTVVSDLMPLEGIEYVSEDGHMVYQEIKTGFGNMITRIADEQTARGDNGGVAPELLFETFVRVDPIPEIDRLHRVELTVRAKAGDMPELPTAAAQRVVPGAEPGTAKLIVDMNDNQPATAEELADPAFRVPSTMVSSDDTLVVKLAERATRDASEDPWARAQALRAAANRHISRKGLETAFASAAETARTRQGDCSEHAVLLCAMLRAEDIPARVASGLVYVDEFGPARHVFGWHMWTQALIDGTWRDLDATLPVAYHAGHVLTGTSSLGDGAGSTDLAGMILLIGNLEIEVGEKGYEAR